MNASSIETEYGGTLYRSRTEARWAVLMDIAGIGYQYEPEGFKLVSGWYVPDFWVSGLDMVKPEDCPIGPGHYTKPRFLVEDLASLKNKSVLVALGWPEEEMNLLAFEPGRIMLERRPIAKFFRSEDIDHAKAYRFDWATPDTARQAMDLIFGAARKLKTW